MTMRIEKREIGGGEGQELTADLSRKTMKARG
jgi:hypothetical protein